MTTLNIAATTNYSTTTLSNIDIFDFDNTATAAVATFAATQFNNIQILNTVLVRGSSGVNRVVVNGTAIDASLWTFDQWTDGTDTIGLFGNPFFTNVITGSSRGDQIGGGGATFANTISGGGGDDEITGGNAGDILNGDAGADILIGGQGDDTFTGGAGNDTIFGNDSASAQDGGEDVYIATGATDGQDKIYDEIGRAHV